MSDLLQRMARAVQLPPATILKIADSASHHYKTYSVPKVNGSTRTVHHPSKALKSLQRWLTYSVFNDFAVHAAAAAYRSGVSPFTHVYRHRLNSYLLRLDFENFFPSITGLDVERFFVESRIPGDDAALMRKLTCMDDGLTIGAPSSPVISNAICFDLDTRISAYSSKSKITYTRYADDMFFSANEKGALGQVPAEITSLIEELQVPSNLQLNESKIWHASKRGRRRITGLTVTPEGRVTVGRQLKRKVRSMVHKLESLTPPERRSLAGYLSHISSIEPDCLNALILKYGIDQVEKARRPPLFDHDDPQGT